MNIIYQYIYYTIRELDHSNQIMGYIVIVLIENINNPSPFKCFLMLLKGYSPI